MRASRRRGPVQSYCGTSLAYSCQAASISFSFLMPKLFLKCEMLAFDSSPLATKRPSASR